MTARPIYAVHVDHLNRPVMLTDSAKTTVWWASYEPFGKVRATGGTLTQNLGLPGQWFQLANALAYNWHRHYDATTGRHTTADPLGLVDGPSVFAYAGNAPHRMVDPSGLNPLALSAACAANPACRAAAAAAAGAVYQACKAIILNATPRPRNPDGSKIPVDA